MEVGRWELKILNDIYDISENYRYCTKCKVLLKKEMFYKYNLSKKGTQNYCKVCMYKARYKIKTLSERKVKMCIKCCNIMKYVHFYKNVLAKNGCHSWCIECSDEINRNYGKSQENAHLYANIHKYEEYFKGVI